MNGRRYRGMMIVAAAAVALLVLLIVVLPAACAPAPTEPEESAGEVGVVTDVPATVETEGDPQPTSTPTERCVSMRLGCTVQKAPQVAEAIPQRTPAGEKSSVEKSPFVTRSETPPTASAIESHSSRVMARCSA